MELAERLGPAQPRGLSREGLFLLYVLKIALTIVTGSLFLALHATKNN